MNDAILSLIITGAFAFGGLVVRYCFISKCDQVKCCGCELHRVVGAETTNPEIQIPVTSPRGNEEKNFNRI